MATLNISAAEIQLAIDLNAAGRASEAWALLGEKGDAYAYLASAILADDPATMPVFARFFYEMVRIHWNNTSGGELWGSDVFKAVGQQHLTNYLDLLRSGNLSDGTYTLPTTEQIEASYKQALMDSFLSPITAVDSMFSVLDTAAGDGGGALLDGDFSWAQIMDLANAAMGGPRWESDRIVFNSDVFTGSVALLDAAVTLGRDALNALDAVGAGAVVLATPFAPTYWLLKLADATLDYTVVDFVNQQAVTQLLRHLDPAVTSDLTAHLLMASDTNDHTAFGNLVDRLGKTFNLNLPPSSTSRAQLFENVKAIGDWRTAAGNALTLRDLTPFTAAQIASIAENNLAYRYALVNLNPFAVLGNDALYAAHNANGELDLASDTNASGQLSKAYLQDRAQLLFWEIKYRSEDQTGGRYTMPFGLPVPIPGDIRYEDNATGTPYVLTIDGVDLGLSPERRILFGGQLADALSGGDADDHLYGMAGNDELQGNAGHDLLDGGSGDDTLNGGTGFDTYLVGLGSDTIQDVDGAGQIKDKTGQLISGLIEQRLDGTCVFIGDPTIAVTRSADLTLTLADGTSIKIQNFQSGQLGLTVANAATAIATTGTILGDQGADHADHLNGTAGNDLILAGEADDVIFAAAGDDSVEGGTGQDRLDAGDGNDRVIGGEGADIGSGGAGADRLYADAEISLEAAIAAGDNALGSGQQGDWLNGGLGDDILIGGAGNDALLGGGGNDIIVGGAGDDLINAGADRTAVDFDWTVTDYGSTFSRQWGPAVIANEGSDAGGNDLIYAGNGNDFALGGDGDDYLDGGDGDDTLAGNEGSDQLFGGAGADHLTGDANVDVDNNGVAVSQGNDYLDGEDGNDWLQGEGGSDDLFGGAGDDTLMGDSQLVNGARHAADYLDGEAGNDLLLGQGGNDTMFGGEGDDTMGGDDDPLEVAYHGADEMHGGSGNDVLVGHGGSDTLFGDDGNDTLFGGGALTEDLLGDDWLDGGAGDDQLIGQGGNDQLLGGSGRDSLWGGVGDDTLQGGSEADRLLGGDGNDHLAGDDGDDILHGEAGDDRLSGGAGSDRLFGALGSDWLDGGDGNDEVQGGDAADTLFGGSGDDLLAGNVGDDRLDGGGDNDELQGGDGADTLSGGAGNDRLFGDAGNDALRGDEGSDQLDGGSGIDALDGGAGDDLLRGGAGSDTLAGGAGDDVLFGDQAADTYVFGRGYGRDSIYDYDGSVSGTGTLQFTADVRPEDIRAYRQGDDLVLAIAGTDDAVIVRKHFVVTSVTSGTYFNTYYYGHQLANVTFADGTIWPAAEIPMFLGGTTGHDAIGGTALTDVFGASAGSDYMSGGGGSDTYHFALGGGQDLIDEKGIAANVDSLIVDAGISPAEVLVRRVNNDLVIALADSPDQVTISNHFSSTASGLEQIRFASDGTVWDRPLLEQLAVTGTALGDQLVGGAAGDVISGGGGNDTINGAAGDDSLDGGTGNDSLLGGAGNDTYFFGRGYGADTIGGEDGVGGWLDQIVFNADVLASEVVLTPDHEDLVLSIAGTLDQLRISGYFHDFGSGAIGVVEQIRFLADDTVWDAAAIRSRLPQATESADLLYGAEGSDALGGLGGNDTLVGGRGDDTLDGGTGNDLLVGGAGNDTYRFDIGSGFDTIDDRGAASATRTNAVRLGAGFTPANIVAVRDGEDLRLSSADGANQLTIRSQYKTDFTTYIPYGVSQVIFDDGTVWDQNKLSTVGLGTAAADVLYGTPGKADALYGAAGNDSIYGFAGDDRLDGGTGNDLLVGGIGDDTYVVDSATDVVVEAPGEGADSIQSSVSATIAANVEKLILTGTAAINGYGDASDNQLFGNAVGNVLDGGAGNDFLSGDGGVDTLIGGTGDDTFSVGDADIVIENANEGTDTVLSSISFALSDHVENLSLTGVADIDATGNTLDNVLTGNSGNNILDGGVGADTMQGMSGDDTYRVDHVGDRLIESADQGIDTAYSAVTYTLAANVENLTLSGSAAIDGIGNSLANTLVGNSANNVLTGGAGGDTYFVSSGDTVIESADDGIDTVVAGFTYTLGANVENLTLTGTSRINGTGNALDNAILGNSANNILTGGAGNDWLDGRGGTDKFLGGTGNDFYVIDDTRDAITENVNEGIDTVQVSFSYTLGANLENLVLAPNAPINATGNAANNVLTGNALANTMNGAAGADSMIGGGGNDTYIVDNVGDVVWESANEGTDIVQSLVTFSLAENVENLTLTGTSAIDGTGNDAANTLTGNSAANVLAGGGGDDIYVVAAGDTVVENVNEGVDTVQSAVAFTLGANIENLILTGAKGISGTGNGLDNVLTGNSAANVLAGGAGNDTYVVGSADTVIENADSGIDTVLSAVSFTLGDHVENLTLTGTAAINGTGNGLNNVLTGNAAANVLAGGAGDDIYVVGAGDTVVENSNEGTDLVLSAVTFTLSAGVENLTLSGSGYVDGTGNDLANVLIGSDGHNVLDGRAGADYMAGGRGNDTYVVDDVGDMVVEFAGEGVDTVQSYFSFTSGGGIENVTLLGASAIDATGDSENNVLTGNGAANTLTGGAGNDTLNGGGGADTLIGGTGNDSYLVSNTTTSLIENADEGIDTVQSSVTHTLVGNVENLTLTGFAGINGTGNDLDNVLVGNSGDNVLDGGAGADTLIGGAGNDTLIGGAGDSLAGGSGNDLYILIDGRTVSDTEANAFEAGGGGIDTIQSAGSVDIGALVWSSGSYHIVGDIENVTLTGSIDAYAYGNDSNNVLIGNNGDNYLSGAGGDDWIEGGDGNDRLFGGSGTNTLIGGAGNDDLDGQGGAGLMDGGAGDDLLRSLYSTGPITLRGGLGNDTFAVDLATVAVVENSGEGTDTVLWSGSGSYTLAANVENMEVYSTSATSVTGNALDNLITDNGSAHTLSGGAGNDTLDGGGGADTLIGGTGNDVYVVGNSAATVIENAGEGSDTILTTASYVLTAANVENVTLIGTSAINATGNAGDNVLTGNSAANVLTGGAGNDTYVVGLFDTVVENANAGTDTIHAAINYTLGADLENLTLTGSASLTATGNALANVLIGNAGSNVLDGAAGGDTMAGGQGDDIYVVDNIADVVTETPGEGSDTVESNVTFALSANAENLTLTGFAAIDGTGNTLNNVLTGNSAANTLSGGYGDDIYVIGDALDSLVEYVGEGVDTVLSSVAHTLGANLENLTLTGATALTATGNALDNILTGNGAGSTLRGGLGDDTYVVGSGGDIVVEDAGGGVDTVRSSVGYTLDANVENLILVGGVVNGSGNELDNVLTGTAFANVLDGGVGADTMRGGGGDDWYTVDNVGDVVVENAGEGIDTVWSSVSHTVAVNVENLTLTGLAATDATGNGLDNVLTGNAASNVLSGGLGNDTYVIGSGDTVVEYAGEGTDTIQSAVTHTLAMNVENLTLTGTAISGTGNSLDNALVGNAMNNALIGGAGNDILDGAQGSDTLVGGVGSDTYVVDNAGDVVSEQGDEGTDTVIASVTYTLADNLENLTLAGSAAISGTGNSHNNVLVGNAKGSTLSGGLGDDIYVVGAGDVIFENAGEGVDLVQAGISYTLGANLENLTLTGTLAINGTGNETGNALVGNAANNTLDGKAGADTMIGGAGDDVYMVDHAADLVVELANGGTDMVWSEVDYTLGDDLENLSLASGFAVNGTGNASHNVLTGGMVGNLLSGLDGNDFLDGGFGADTLLGGSGDDTYVIDNINDVVIEDIGEGTDTVRSGIDYVLGSHLENLTLTGFAAVRGEGNDLDNVIIGNLADNFINGGIGADTMSGGYGDDVYVVDNVGDMVVENASEGIDTVLSSITFMLGAQVENLTLTGTTEVAGFGNGANNVLIGNAVANTLSGAAGEDWLDGGAGADSLIGGGGNDTYVVDDAGDRVQEEVSSGIDSVLSSVTFTLGGYLETLTLTGLDAIDGTGNELANVLVGNAANNVLDGGAGADAMTGGAGNDLYIVDDAGDWVGEYANHGVDQVRSSVAYTLGVNLENLTLTGVGAIDGHGNQLDNVIVGNSAINVLSGAEGNDTLDGGAGIDRLLGGQGNDTYRMGYGSGADTVSENDATDGNADLAQFGAGIAIDQLWFRQVGNNLEASLIGTADTLTIENWYAGNAYRVEQFKTTDGMTLFDSRVDYLVQAMAAFAPPAAGQTTLSPEYQTALAPVIAANWQ